MSVSFHMRSISRATSGSGISGNLPIPTVTPSVRPRRPAPTRPNEEGIRPPMLLGHTPGVLDVLVAHAPRVVRCPHDRASGNSHTTKAPEPAQSRRTVRSRLLPDGGPRHDDVGPQRVEDREQVARARLHIGRRHVSTRLTGPRDPGGSAARIPRTSEETGPDRVLPDAVDVPVVVELPDEVRALPDDLIRDVDVVDGLHVPRARSLHSAHHPVDVPAIGHTLQLMLPGVLEREAAPRS